MADNAVVATSANLAAIVYHEVTYAEIHQETESSTFGK